ncbi:cyanophycinase [Shewanella gaetbuli]|uniref:Cyanophycinase n=1 Tax=Shewanella gaetbuli TaxID=220752 RepID=A0A9X1ZNF6_9GAMM|nr:cyanophycinase [Shewanella gaetbuli]MCL1144177.1 cyanophycinase [Shewanella gaetbuli]
MKIISTNKLFIFFSALAFSSLFQLLFLGNVWAEQSVLSKREKPLLPGFDLMLVGGGLKTCSSLSANSCSENVVFSPNSKLSIQYHFSLDWLERAFNHESLQTLSLTQINSLRKASKQAAQSSVSLNQLKDAVGQINKHLLNDLTDLEYYALLDLLEQEQRSEYGEILHEQVILNATAKPYGPAIYRLFTLQALLKKQLKNPDATRPVIGIVTASARDPFESISYYTSAFEQAGADVIWLPLDAALQAGIYNKQCDKLPLLRQKLQGNVDKARLYPTETELQHRLCESPEELYQQLEQIDGLFLNGGDQSLSLTAWLKPDQKPSKALTVIRSRLFNKDIVIGGTSAGTAVMTANNMITGGTSDGAMQYGVLSVKPPSERCEINQCEGDTPATAVTYRAEGGLGLFPFGIMDTHFSERERQIRLLMLTASTGSEMGFGVDENTALLVNLADKDLKVIGEHGVWVIEQAQVNLNDNGKQRYEGVSHYLSSGSQANINNNHQLVNIEFVSRTVLVDIAVDYPVYQQWIMQACREGRLSRKLIDDFELTILPTSTEGCQLALNNKQNYQSIKILLQQKDD